MKKSTASPYWAARQRMRYIELCAWWKGVVNRNDIATMFAISLAQASSDLRTYLETNPGAMIYNLRQKRYEASESMKCVMSSPSLVSWPPKSGH